MNTKTELRWLNEESADILYNGYIDKDISVEQRIEDICNYVANKCLGKPELSIKFQEIIKNGWSSLSSPIWSNVATDKGFGISCFSSYIPDSLDGITSALSEVAIQTKMGGGTSGYFGDLRASGTLLSSGAKSSGAVSFIKWFEAITQTVMQNGTRRGYFAAYLDIDHPEIEEFLKVKDPTNNIQDINTAVTIPEGWMESMIEGDKEKRNIWAKVLESRRRKGIPYIFFSDNVNNNKPQVYKDKGIDIKSSNLCVASDTEILTKEYGYVSIGSFENEEVEIWNGEEWSKVTVKKTGTNQPLLEVTTNVGYHLDCTPQHHFYIKGKDGEIKKVEAQELKIGDVLIDFKLPVVDNQPVILEGAEYKVGDEIRIEGVNKLPYKEDTYCFTEKKRGMGMFNGILTGQCAEVLLESNDDESFVCCLSSMNLELYDEWKDTDAVYLMTLFLDGILTDFIDKVKDEKHMVRNYNFAKRQRALGLG